MFGMIKGRSLFSVCWRGCIAERCCSYPVIWDSGLHVYGEDGHCAYATTLSNLGIEWR